MALTGVWKQQWWQRLMRSSSHKPEPLLFELLLPSQGQLLQQLQYICWEELVRSSRSRTGSSPEVVEKWSCRGSDKKVEAASKRRFTVALHRWRKVAALRDEKHKWQSQVFKVDTARSGCRSASLTVRCDVVEPISAKQRKGKGNRVMVTLFTWMRSAATIAGYRRKKRLKEEGCDLDLSFVSGKQWGSGPSWDPEHSQASHLRECLRGRRLWMPRMLERCSGILLENMSTQLLNLNVGFQEIYSNKKENSSARCEKLSDGCGFAEKGQMMPEDRC
ncbi:hypothetical protein GW17_00034717 [Ensete ventricosum]|nr:hypothetical protein GW17_00034717 [Ensete ventricosum]